MINLQYVHKESFSAQRLIGRRHTNADRVDGGYGARWKECFSSGFFTRLEAVAQPWAVNAPVGFMRCDGNERFEYWIGRLFPADTEVPEGYDYLDLPASDVGVVWLRGKEKDGIYGQHERCEQAMLKQGWEFFIDPQGNKLFFERYFPDRFDRLDSKKRIILDYGFYIK